MSNANRTDPHRPGKILPADYTYVFSYDLGGVDPREDPPFNMDLLKEYETGDSFFVNPKGSSSSKCDVCGSRFRHGDVWRHNPSGEHIHLGWECAEKYALLADRTEYEMARNREIVAHRISLVKLRKSMERDAFLDAHPELRECFENKDKHAILNNLHDSFMSYCQLSEKQIALAVKILEEVKNPKPEKVVILKDAPTGKVTVKGKILSAKGYEGAYGIVFKMLVEVVEPEGTWKTFGTVPSSIMWANGQLQELKGKEVEFTATVAPKAGEKGFSYFKRPTKASLKNVDIPTE